MRGPAALSSTSLQRGLFDADAARAGSRGGPAPARRAGSRRCSIAAPSARRPASSSLDGRSIASSAFALSASQRRTIGFIVGAEGLSVRAPKWVALRDVDAAVREKGRWILRKLAEQRERARAAGSGAHRLARRRDDRLPRRRPLTIVLDPHGDSAPAQAALTRRRPRRAAPARCTSACRTTPPTSADPRCRAELAAAPGAARLRGALPSTSRRGSACACTRLSLSSAHDALGQRQRRRRDPAALAAGPSSAGR